MTPVEQEIKKKNILHNTKIASRWRLYFYPYLGELIFHSDFSSRFPRRTAYIIWFWKKHFNGRSGNRRSSGIFSGMSRENHFRKILAGWISFDPRCYSPHEKKITNLPGNCFFQPFGKDTTNTRFVGGMFVMCDFVWFLIQQLFNPSKKPATFQQKHRRTPSPAKPPGHWEPAGARGVMDGVTEDSDASSGYSRHGLSPASKSQMMQMMILEEWKWEPKGTTPKK